MKGLKALLLSMSLVLSATLPVLNFGDVQAIKATTNDKQTKVMKSVQENNHSDAMTQSLKSPKALGTTTLPTVPAAPKPAVITSANGINEVDANTWNEFYSAMMNININVIHIQNDFQSTDGSTAAEVDRITPMRSIKINGNGHTIDFRGISFYNNSSLGTNKKVEWEINHLTMYGRNFYGPIKTDSNASGSGSYGAMVYDNVTYIGAQLTASYRWTIDFRGSVENHSRNNYISPFDNKVYGTQSNQVNIEAKDVIVREGANYKGTTENAGVFHLGQSGRMTLEKNANMVMTSDGSGGEYGTNVLYLQGKIIAGKNAKLTLNTRMYGSQRAIDISGNGNGIEAREGAEINVNVVGRSGSYDAISMGADTSIIIDDGASLNVNSQKLGTGDLISAGARTNFKIGKGATFNAISDGSANHAILNFGSNSKFQFADAKLVNLQFTRYNLDGGARLIKMNSGKLEVDVQDVKAWNRTDIANNSTAEADYHWTPMFNMITAFSMTTSSIQNASSISSEMRTKYNREFNPQNFSRLLYTFVEDTNVEIVNKPNDNVGSLDSQEIHGLTSPGAYVRLTGDEALPTPKVPSNITGSDDVELTSDFTVIADAAGKFMVNAQVGKNFTASNTIKAFAFNGGKSATAEVAVLDKTAPTAEGIELVILKGEKIPNAREFLIKIKDTNPKNGSITHTYLQNYSYLSNEVGLHDVVLIIYDVAGNRRNIPAKLRVLEVGVAVEANDIQVNLSDLKKNTTDALLRSFLLSESKAKAWGIENNVLVDYTSALTINNLASIRQMKPGSYNITASFDLGVAKPEANGKKIFNVTVLNDEAVAPTKPDNPGSGKPDEQENLGTGQTGLLKLDYAPSKFDFGTVKYGFNSVTANAIKTKSEKQWLQVSDDRASEDVTNWSIQVAENHPLQSTSGHLLEGATIQVPKGKLYNQKTGSSSLVSGVSALESSKVDISTTPSVVFKANHAKGKVQQISTDVWNTTDVLLHIPGNQELEFENYTNTITWTLVAEP